MALTLFRALAGPGATIPLFLHPRNILSRYPSVLCILSSILTLTRTTVAVPFELTAMPVEPRDMLDGLLNASGYLVLINATPYQWNRTFTQSYHMNNWDFPAAVLPGRSLRRRM